MNLGETWKSVAAPHSARFELSFLAAVFVLGVSLRVGYLMFADGGAFLEERVHSADAEFYQGVGAALAQGHGYTLDGRPTAWRAPLYPFVISLFYRANERPLFSLRLFQCLLGGLTPLLVYAIARRLGERGAGRLAALACALSYELINMAPYDMTETLYTFLFLAWLLSLYFYDGRPSASRSACGGLLLGLLLLTRPVLLAAAILLLPWFLRDSGHELPARRRVLHWAVFCACTLLLTAPWAIRNCVVFGTLAPLTTETGKMIYTSHSPGSTGGSGGWHAIGADWTAPTDLNSTNEAVSSRLMAKAGIRYALTRPAKTIGQIPHKFWNMWRPWMADTSFLSSALACAYYVPVILLALCGIVSGWSYRKGVGLIYLVIGYTVVLHLALIGIVRYRYPLLPLLTLLAALFLTHAATSAQRDSKP